MKTTEEAIAALNEASYAIGEALRLVEGVLMHSTDIRVDHRRFLESNRVNMVLYGAACSAIAREIDPVFRGEEA